MQTWADLESVWEPMLASQRVAGSAVTVASRASADEQPQAKPTGAARLSQELQPRCLAKVRIAPVQNPIQLSQGLTAQACPCLQQVNSGWFIIWSSGMRVDVHFNFTRPGHSCATANETWVHVLGSQRLPVCSSADDMPQVQVRVTRFAAALGEQEHVTCKDLSRPRNRLIEAHCQTARGSFACRLKAGRFSMHSYTCAEASRGADLGVCGVSSGTRVGKPRGACCLLPALAGSQHAGLCTLEAGRLVELQNCAQNGRLLP